MLKIILGLQGSGKTEYIMQELKEKVKNQKSEKLMLIVPEQTSFETERKLLNTVGVKDGNKINVMSFKRLVDFVFRELGGLVKNRLNDGGRNIFMKMALDQASDQLKFYKKASTGENMVDTMIYALKEFKACGILPKELLKKESVRKNEILKQKIEETSLVLDIYHALIKNSYVDPLDDLDCLKEKLLDYNFFKGYSVFINNFDGFTQQELNIIEIILNQAKECTVSLCMNNSALTNDETDVFYSTKKTMRSLINIAKKNNIQIKPFVELKSNNRSNTGLSLLEKSFLQDDVKEYDILPEDIVIYSAKDLYDECNFVANKISELVIENGFRYKDFAVISRNIEEYKGIIDFVFKKHKIEYFCDNPESLETKPLITLVMSAFDIINKSYRSEDIFKYLKTGLAGLNTEEISQLENYVLLWKINGKKWKEEFISNPDGFSKSLKESDKEYLLKLNELKNKVIEPLNRFEKNIKNSVGEIHAKAVYTLLEDINAFENLCKTANELKKSSNMFLAQEQLRVWDLLMSVLDQTAMVLKNKITSKQYSEYLKLAIKSYKLMFIPKSLDEVMISNIDRAYGQHAKVSFIIGASDGDFPKNPEILGIFSNSDRERLSKEGINIYNPIETINIEERLLAYKAVTSAKEKLFISWPLVDNKQNEKKPSIIVKETKRIFKGLYAIDENSIPQTDKVWAKEPAFDMCAKHFANESLFSQTLKHYFKNDKKFEPKIKSLENILNTCATKFANEKNASEIFKGTINLSASQIECFHICKFKYFCRYILNAKERTPAEFNFLQYGDLMHYIFENILKKHHNEKLNLLNEKMISQDVKDLLNEYMNDKLGGLDDKSPRFKYLFFRLLKTAQIVVMHIIMEISQSEFKPCDFELDISDKNNIKPVVYDFSSDTKINILGKIDRVDMMKKKDKTYIRVIDYKTGKKEFKISDILYGLNMQMLIYLTALWKNGKGKYKKTVPCGILYMPVIAASVSANKDELKEETQKKQNKLFKMNGMVLNDETVICGMEKKADGKFIPVALKNGKVDKSDCSFDISQMDLISKYIKKTIIKMVKQLKNGKIEPNPIIINNKQMCEYCEYFAACFHEKDDTFRKALKLKKADVMKIIESEETLLNEQ